MSMLQSFPFFFFDTDKKHKVLVRADFGSFRSGYFQQQQLRYRMILSRGIF
jgi:hypothetical protein